jgi:mitochondrial import receptor subunit TOM40
MRTVALRPSRTCRTLIPCGYLLAGPLPCVPLDRLRHRPSPLRPHLLCVAYFPASLPLCHVLPLARSRASREQDINQESTLILRPAVHEGLMFQMNMPVGSQSFSLGQCVELGSRDHPGSYAFTANYFTNRLVMISRCTPVDGRVTGRIFYTHTPSLTSKIIADVGYEPDSSKASWDLDYRGEDFCSQLKLANGGVAAISYLQSVTPNLALGGEGFYQGKSQFSAITAAAKYANSTDVASLTVASFGPIIASYMHRVNPRSAFASELYIDGRTKDSHVTVGYRYDLTSSTVMGNVDSSGRVSATLENRLNPILTFTLAGELDHARGDSRFGFGVNLN